MNPAITMVRLSVCITAFAVISGCCSVDSGRFDAFSSSTHDLLKGADAEAERIGEVQKTYFILAAAGEKLSKDSFEPAVGDQNIDLVRQFNQRVAILEAIANYADALSAFARKDYQSGVDSASARLDGSIVSLGKTAGAGPQLTTDAGYLATAVDVLGHEIIEYERVKALQRAMSVAQPGLVALADRLTVGDAQISQQITNYRDFALHLVNKNIEADPSAILRVEFSALMAGPVSDANLSLDKLSQLNAGILRLPGANQELRDSLCAPETPLTNLKELISEGQRLNKFHGSLQ